MRLSHQTEYNSSDTQRLENLNYLVASCTYWGKKRFFAKKSGVSYFAYCKFVFEQIFKNFIAFYSGKNYLCNDIKFEQFFFIINGEIIIKYCLILKKTLLSRCKWTKAPWQKS